MLYWTVNYAALKLVGLSKKVSKEKASLSSSAESKKIISSDASWQELKGEERAIRRREKKSVATVNPDSHTAVEHSHIVHWMDQSSSKDGCYHGAPPRPSEPQQTLDLAKWKGHRVLAKMGIVYMPGVIVSINGPSTLTVLFDQDQVSVAYNDVTCYFDIVADTSPAHAQVRRSKNIKTVESVLAKFVLEQAQTIRSYLRES